MTNLTKVQANYLNNLKSPDSSDSNEKFLNFLRKENFKNFGKFLFPRFFVQGTQHKSKIVAGSFKTRELVSENISELIIKIINKKKISRRSFQNHLYESIVRIHLNGMVRQTHKNKLSKNPLKKIFFLKNHFSRITFHKEKGIRWKLYIMDRESSILFWEIGLLIFFSQITAKLEFENISQGNRIFFHKNIPSKILSLKQVKIIS